MPPMKVIKRPLVTPRPNPELARNPVNSGLRGDFGGAPVVFSAFLTDLTPGNTYNLDTKTLQPGFRTPYWIDEIRVSALGRTPSGVLRQVQLDGMGCYLEFRFQTGHYAFSRNPAPIGLHAPRWSHFDTGTNLSGVNLISGVFRDFASFRWPLPKPLYMPAGDAVQALVRYRSFPALASYGREGFTIDRLNVTYVGRLAAPGTPAPQKRCVPWVAAFEKPGNVAQAQTNDEFRNPFSDKPLYVQRFTSRTYFASDSIFFKYMAETNDYQLPTYNNLPFTQVKLYDSLGYAIVPNYTPVGDVFDSVRGAWTFGRTLGPREQFDLQLQQAGGTDFLPPDYLTQVGIVGYREETI